MSQSGSWWRQYRAAVGLAWRIIPGFLIFTTGVGWLYGVDNPEYPVIRVILGASAAVYASITLLVLVMFVPALMGRGRLLPAMVFTLPILFLGWTWFYQIVVVGARFGPYTQLSGNPGQAWEGVLPWATAYLACQVWMSLRWLWDKKSRAVE